MNATDAYASSITRLLVRTVAEVELDEPYASYDPVHALWVMERYIESMSSFALGMVAGALACESALAQRHMSEETGVVTMGRWFERDTSLVDALRPWLCSRTCALAADIRALVADSSAPPLADTVIAERFAAELRAGWQIVLRAICGDQTSTTRSSLSASATDHA